jgi:hypothetical protein
MNNVYKFIHPLCRILSIQIASFRAKNIFQKNCFNRLKKPENTCNYHNYTCRRLITFAQNRYYAF